MLKIPKITKIGIGAFILLIVLLKFNPFSINDAGERQVIQTLGGDLDVKFAPGIYFSGFGSKVTTYPNNTTIQIGSAIEEEENQAELHVAPHFATFSEGDRATVKHTAKWDLPNVKEQMVELHTTYNSIENLAGTTLLPYQKQIASFSTQRMSSEAHYSGGESQLNEYFQDQLRNGQVLLITSTKTRKLQDGTEKSYIEVKPKLNEDGTIKRSISDIQKYGLVASFASIDEVTYDPRIYEKLKDKIDAASDEATAKQKLITAQQEALTVKAQGEKLIAETKAREEAQKLEAVIRSEKATAVAAENLKQAKLNAASELALKKAQAEGDKLKVAAGLSPKEKAEFKMRTEIGVAEALAKRPVPTFVTSGGGKEGGLANSYTMKNMLLLQRELSK